MSAGIRRSGRHVAAQRSLRHVYWLGGAPCAGKSTVAGILADQFRLAIYHTDDWRPRTWWRRSRRLDASRI